MPVIELYDWTRNFQALINIRQVCDGSTKVKPELAQDVTDMVGLRYWVSDSGRARGIIWIQARRG